VLKTRTLSALVMAPPALLAVWAGGYAFAALATLAAILMAWDWHRMACGGFGLSGRIAALGMLAAVPLAVTFAGPALALVFGVAVLSMVVAAPADRRWAGWGALYVGVPCVSLVWLRGDAQMGTALVGWLLLVVWATDIGAYASGRLIGGPLLMPRVSPKKTWAGLLGGMVSAALVAGLFVIQLELGNAVWVALAGAAVAVVAQIGDLFESWVKRRWGVKDSSSIIPGHGGVMDRVDGLMAAGLAVALLSLLSGKSILAWQ
jgi:phosphatidate cytidylyltransferase